jgi:hypothetical protein
MNTAENVQEQEGAGAAAPASETPEPFSLDKLDRAVFSNSEDDLAKAMELISAIREAGFPESASHYNFDPEQPLADGYSLYITPVRERSKVEGEGSKLVALTIYAAPSFEMVLADTAGEAYLRSQMERAFAMQHAASIRPNTSGVVPPAPYTLADHIERKTRGDSLKTFNELKNILVPSLKKIGLSSLTAATLRKCFSNAAVAQSLFPDTPQEAWEKVLVLSENLAKSKNLDPTIFKVWGETRDQGILEHETLDLSQLDIMLGGSGDADDADEAEQQDGAA